MVNINKVFNQNNKEQNQYLKNTTLGGGNTEHYTDFVTRNPHLKPPCS